VILVTSVFTFLYLIKSIAHTYIQGPVFAIIGAWLVYQLQNKDVTAKDVPDSILQKGMIITALGFILSNFGPIDDW
jgi:hypothetical protein